MISLFLSLPLAMAATTSTRTRNILFLSLALALQTEALGRTSGRGRRLVGGAIAGAYLLSSRYSASVLTLLARHCHRMHRRCDHRHHTTVLVLPSVQAPSRGKSSSCARSCRRRTTAILRGPTRRRTRLRRLRCALPCRCIALTVYLTALFTLQAPPGPPPATYQQVSA